jgi:hypothetical protein
MPTISIVLPGAKKNYERQHGEDFLCQVQCIKEAVPYPRSATICPPSTTIVVPAM